AVVQGLTEAVVGVEDDLVGAGLGDPGPGVDLALGLEHEGPRRGAHREGVDVLAELALEERQRVGPPDPDDVSLDGGASGGVDLGHRCAAFRWASRRWAVMRLAAGTAMSSARALFWHSRCSSSGTLSATMPAPAWTEAMPSSPMTIVRMAMAVSMLPEKSR